MQEINQSYSELAWFSFATVNVHMGNMLNWLKEAVDKYLYIVCNLTYNINWQCRDSDIFIMTCKKS